METKVSVEAKREFIRWVREAHRFKNLSGLWVLEYLLREESRAGKVCFVRKAENYKRGIIVGTKNSKSSALGFFKDGYMTETTEEAFTFVRLINIEKFYVQIDYEGIEDCPRYHQVLEEDPQNYRKEAQSEKMARELLEESIRIGNERRVRELIDEALINREDEKIKSLMKLLN